MSSTFREILDERSRLEAGMVTIQILIPLLSLLSVFLRRIWVALVVIFTGSLCSCLIAKQIFDSWWASLAANAGSREDLCWIRDHDGGRAVVYAACVSRAVIFFLITAIAAWLLIRYRRARYLHNSR